MAWIAALTLLAFNTLRGFNEGMIMTVDGVRYAAAFQYYHRLRVLEYAFAMWFAIAVNGLDDIIGVLSLGVAVLSWELFESAYAFARYGEITAPTENLFGVGYRLTGKSVEVVHYCRWVIAVTLIIGGMVS
jgi:hypothetical protein